MFALIYLFSFADYAGGLRLRLMDRFKDRRRKAQSLMVEQGVAALQVTSRENYFYLTGDVRSVARLFLPQEGEPTIIVFDEEVEDAKKATDI